MNEWWQIIAKASGTDVWRLIGTISQWAELNASDFNKQLDKLEEKGKPILAALHCPGGSVYEGLQLYTRLSESPLDVTMDVEGIAGSMGSALLMAANKRRIAKHGRIMIHQARNSAGGSAAKLRQAAEETEENNQALAEIYAEAIKWKHPERDAKWVLANWMIEGQDTWFDAKKALKAGLVHEIKNGSVKSAPTADFSFEKMVAYYDENLIDNKTGEEDTPPQTPSKMDKQELILFLAGIGITFGDKVTASMEDDEFKSALKGELKTLAAQAKKTEALQAQINEGVTAEFDEVIDKAVEVGKISEKQAEHYRKLGDDNGRETVIALINDMEEPVDLEASVKEIKGKKQNSSSAKKDDWNYGDWEKKDPEGLLALADDDPEKFEELVAAYEPVEQA